MICIPCNMEFPSDAIYIRHKNSGHVAFREKGIVLDSPPEPLLPPGFPEPTSEFVEMVNRIENKTEEPKPSQHPSELPPASPITLEYIWRGECPSDRASVTTLELDVANKHFCIAICSICRKQLATMEVAKL